MNGLEHMHSTFAQYKAKSAMERMMVTHVQRMQADYRSFYAGHVLCHGEQLDPSAMRQGKHIAA
eukprot:scaffold3447_cov519-Prasinococcus_capsulatus_cf.AAC.2